MAKGNTYTRSYSDFIGVDLSSDPKAVSPNRLAYSVNMWRDYESAEGAAIETFPGFRRLVNGLGAVHGLYHFRAKDGNEYLVVHAGTRLYAFDSEAIADYNDAELDESAALSGVSLADSDSMGHVCNNNLYILDGSHIITVKGVGDENGATSVTASEVDAYIPTTYFDGKPYEQRNMLIDEAWEKTTEGKIGTVPIDIKYDLFPEGYIYGGKSWESFVDHRKIDNGYFNYTATGFCEGMKSPYIYVSSIVARSDDTYYPLWFGKKAFENEHIVRKVDAATNSYRVVFDESCFAGCENLSQISLYITEGSTLEEDGSVVGELTVYPGAFSGCRNLKSLDIYVVGGDKVVISTDIEGTQRTWLSSGISNGDFNIPEGVTINIETSPLNESELILKYNHLNRYRTVSPCEKALAVKEVRRTFDNKSIDFGYELEEHTENGEVYETVKTVYIAGTELEYRPEGSDASADPLVSDVTVLYELDPLGFSTIEKVKNFKDGNPDYKRTGIEAICGCTKSAVFDGRVFLTGNPELPNTVFYSHRNLTGANDPTYFGAYNYFNDGDGNTPNVDLLSTPSMLMVLKNNTMQDGSVYYHVGTYNTDEYSKDLVPRIYPSTSGVAGLGSAGKTIPGTTACNFLDDPVFLSTRGLEAVGKQTVNLERTLTHRSSNVDRILIKEELSQASLAEWKGFLVICCQGNFYLADSRVLSQHADGSYQYEWYYLEGLGTYDNYRGGFRYLRDWYSIDEGGTLLSECEVFVNGAYYKLHEYCALGTENMSFNGTDNDILAVTAIRPDGSKFDFYVDQRYDPPLALENVDEERYPATGATFYPATKIVTVGERLFFGTANGDVCVINTDKRGVPDYEGQQLEHDRISAKWYSFNGMAYPSICVTKLDDCTGKSLSKATVPGTTVARFKMMPGSRCRVEVSLNGRDFKKIGEAFASRYDVGDLRFDNFAFAENEDSLVVLRELTRNWVDKQYSFISEGFREPFGLYELSYLYYVKGKIRRI